MIRGIRNSKYTKFLWSAIAIYLLNISVDTVDLIPSHVPQDVSFNAQESVIEIVVEKIMGFENAIEETEDADSESPEKKPNVKIDLVFHLADDTNSLTSPHPMCEHWRPEINTFLKSGFYNLYTPPPKFLIRS